MIEGFSDYTRDLDDYEKNTLLPIIVQGMEKKKGAENAVKNGTAIASLKDKGYKISSARFRKLMHVIRVSGMVEGIVATSKGYYIAQTRDEWQSYLKSIKERIQHIQSLETALNEQFTQWDKHNPQPEPFMKVI